MIEERIGKYLRQVEHICGQMLNLFGNVEYQILFIALGCQVTHLRNTLVSGSIPSTILSS